MLPIQILTALSLAILAKADGNAELEAREPRRQAVRPQPTCTTVIDSSELKNVGAPIFVYDATKTVYASVDCGGCALSVRTRSTWPTNVPEPQVPAPVINVPGTTQVVSTVCVPKTTPSPVPPINLCASKTCEEGTTCHVKDGRARCVPNDQNQRCGENLCLPGTVCCNPKCGLCVLPGMSCLQMACDPDFDVEG
jgi:hypothetical protein